MIVPTLNPTCSSENISSAWGQRYLGLVIFAFKNTLTSTLDHKKCINALKKRFSYQCFIKIAMTANRIFFFFFFFFLIKGSGQGDLKHLKCLFKMTFSIA